ncbi:hypothetical protein XaFJ1_GM001460 [Xanthomonas albilineans]|nr:hypothetical protein XaFJ1_GM001460 [Xanthomonas albilineans]
MNAFNRWLLSPETMQETDKDMMPFMLRYSYFLYLAQYRTHLQVPPSHPGGLMSYLLKQE